MSLMEQSKLQWPYNGEGHIVHFLWGWDVCDLTDDDMDILSKEFELWLKKNTKHGYYHYFGGVHVRINFEDPSDAMHCKLRWNGK